MRKLLNLSPKQRKVNIRQHGHYCTGIQQPPRRIWKAKFWQKREHLDKLMLKRCGASVTKLFIFHPSDRPAVDRSKVDHLFLVQWLPLSSDERSISLRTKVKVCRPLLRRYLSPCKDILKITIPPFEASVKGCSNVLHWNLFKRFLESFFASPTLREDQRWCNWICVVDVDIDIDIDVLLVVVGAIEFPSLMLMLVLVLMFFLLLLVVGCSLLLLLLLRNLWFFGALHDFLQDIYTLRTCPKLWCNPCSQWYGSGLLRYMLYTCPKH